MKCCHPKWKFFLAFTCSSRIFLSSCKTASPRLPTPRVLRKPDLRPSSKIASHGIFWRRVVAHIFRAPGNFGNHNPTTLSEKTKTTITTYQSLRRGAFAPWSWRQRLCTSLGHLFLCNNHKTVLEWHRKGIGGIGMSRNIKYINAGQVVVCM